MLRQRISNLGLYSLQGKLKREGIAGIIGSIAPVLVLMIHIPDSGEKPYLVD